MGGMTDRWDQASAAIERVRELHPRVQLEAGFACCEQCSDEWPCPTIAALDGPPATAEPTRVPVPVPKRWIVAVRPVPDIVAGAQADPGNTEIDDAIEQIVADYIPDSLLRIQLAKRILREVVRRTGLDVDARPVPAADTDRESSMTAIEHYEPQWQAADVNYDAAWDIRQDGSGITADRMRTVAQLAAWKQMRLTIPSEQWSAEACDAMAEAVLRVVRDWVAAP